MGQSWLQWKREHPVPTLAWYILPAVAGVMGLLSLTACSRPATPTPVSSATVTGMPVIVSDTPLSTETIPARLPPTSSSPLSTLDRYRAWMEEARSLYPYSEPIESMWAVMLCESEGNADAVGSHYYGLFQYLPETWSGEWNPYRVYSIFDPRAQIFATAKAWADGYQLWWYGCLPGPPPPPPRPEPM